VILIRTKVQVGLRRRPEGFDKDRNWYNYSIQPHNGAILLWSNEKKISMRTKPCHGERTQSVLSLSALHKKAFASFFLLRLTSSLISISYTNA